MKPLTKNILTREALEKELRHLNAADLRFAWTQLVTAAPFLLLFALLTGYGFRNGRDLIAKIFFALIAVAIVSGGLFLLIRNICLAYAERKKLAAGEFLLTHRTLFSKREKCVYRHTEKCFSFEGFEEITVGHTEYQLASPGDEYYIVFYPNEKSVQLLYPCSRYEYRET